jgi:hypothetical protein
MNQKRFDYRWVLDYGTHQKYGPWSKPVKREEDKATNQPRDGLLSARVEGRDYQGHILCLARCDGLDFVGFQFKVIQRMPVRNG